MDWAYEKEWRIFDFPSGTSAELFEDRPFQQEELAAIYLGYRISDNDRKQVVEAVSSWTERVEIFQMGLEPNRYQLSTMPF